MPSFKLLSAPESRVLAFWHLKATPPHLPKKGWVHASTSFTHQAMYHCTQWQHRAAAYTHAHAHTHARTHSLMQSLSEAVQACLNGMSGFCSGCPGQMRAAATVTKCEHNQDWSHTFGSCWDWQPGFLLMSCKGVIQHVTSNNFLFRSLIGWEFWVAHVKTWIPGTFWSFCVFFN